MGLAWLSVLCVHPIELSTLVSQSRLGDERKGRRRCDRSNVRHLGNVVVMICPSLKRYCSNETESRKYRTRPTRDILPNFHSPTRVPHGKGRQHANDRDTH